MASEFRIDWYYKTIYNTFLEDLLNRLFGSRYEETYEVKDLLNPPDIFYRHSHNLAKVCMSNYEECYKDEVIFNTQFHIKDFKLEINDRQFLDKFYEIIEKYNDFIEKNWYRIAYLYTLRRLNEMIEKVNENQSNNKINLRLDNRRLWSSFYISDAATDPNFDEILDILFGRNINNFVDNFNKMVIFCRSISGKNIKDRIVRMIVEKNDEDFKNEKEKIINEFSSIINNSELELCFYDKLVTILRRFASWNPTSAGTADINEIIKILFSNTKILEIFIYKKIADLGFPSIINIKFNEYEVDIITLIDNFRIKIIEVTTRKEIDSKISNLGKLLDLLKENGITSHGLIICLDESDDVSNNNNITRLSIKKLFYKYPYNLLAHIYNT